MNAAATTKKTPLSAKQIFHEYNVTISPQKLGAIRRQTRRSAERMSLPVEEQRYRTLQARWHALHPDAPRDPGYTEDEEFAELFDDMGSDLDFVEGYITECEKLASEACGELDVRQGQT
jgi:hypothetical protein